MNIGEPEEVITAIPRICPVPGKEPAPAAAPAPREPEKVPEKVPA